jgi:diguanylate cyclase (GGDEF)-like protein
MVIAVDSMALFLLFVTSRLAISNFIVSRHKTKYFILTANFVMAELILEIISLIIDCRNNLFCIVLNYIDIILAFIIMPLPIIYILFLHNTFFIKYKNIIFLPVFINAFFLLLNIKYKWIFTITAENAYIHGNFYFSQILISFSYLILLIFSDLYAFRKIDRAEYFVLQSLYILPIAGTAFQMLFYKSGCMIIWSSAAFALILYYIFIRENEFKIDKLTNARNRDSFIKEMEYIKKNIYKDNIWIGVFDVNNLKVINDTYGHNCGDEIIFRASYFLRKAFDANCMVFRTGGDEFCVICHGQSKKSLAAMDNTFINYINDYNKSNSIPLIIAKGYALCKSDNYENIYSVYSSADTNMYKDKRKTKRYSK